MLILGHDEKLLDSEIISLHELTKNTFSPFYELVIDISDSNFNSYNIIE